ncbi:MAG: L-threonylcarbamoyladenylate synthase [Nitrososphaerales archaeon]
MLRLDCSDSSIEIAALEVRKGKVVVYPTDTVYGLGCDPYNDSAVESLLEIKGRERGKPMPLLCSSVDTACKIGKVEQDAKKLAERFWPGALTIVVTLNDRKISDKVTGRTGSIGLRVPDHPCALKLIDACGGVLIGTSANRSGFPSANDANEVLGSISGFDILIDGGRTSGIESTVLKIADKKITVVREGRIKRKEIEEELAYHV